jgi:hypothetical protein
MWADFSTVMLWRMQRTLSICLMVLGLFPTSFGQSVRSIPELRELDQANLLGQQRKILTVPQVALLKRLTARIIHRCAADPGPDDPTTAEEIFSQLRAGHIEVSSQHDTAVVIQGSGACMCGAVGNCPLWVLSDQSHPVLLLRAAGVQTFAVQKRRPETRYDLILGSHISAMQTDLQWFRFDGTIFRRYRCGIANWDDAGGNRLDPPRIDLGRC